MNPDESCRHPHIPPLHVYRSSSDLFCELQAANKWRFADEWGNICGRCFYFDYHMNALLNKLNKSGIEARTNKKRTTYESIFSLNDIDYILKLANLDKRLANMRRLSLLHRK